jgi:hypothetical protein
VPDLRRGVPLVTGLAFAAWWVSQRVLAGQPGGVRLVLLAAIAALAAVELARHRPTPP